MNRSFATCFALLLGALSVNAQLSRGYISGTVSDASGAVIVGADVTITNTATNIARAMKTNDAGLYRFPAVDPGDYFVEFARAGFGTRKVGPITVGTTQEVVLNQSLEVATTATTLEVIETPAGVVLAKATASVERKLDMRTIENLPLTGATRDINNAALIAPTAARGPDRPASRRTANARATTIS